ncbi:MAG: type 1 glutamine amidotransferase [Bacteroidales bacterium]|nr:type 1 glutamine amidotransferase [Bacteroidales bacterium]
MSLRIHCFQHVPYEDLGCIKNWIEEKGHHLTITKFWEIYRIPKVTDIDVLIILGGPMSIFHDDECPWLGIEKQYIKKAIDQKKKILGICLGAQLVANRLGAEVYQGKYAEIGFFPIHRTPESDNITCLKTLSDKATVFHWHNDTFEIPENAVSIAFSEACQNQGFMYNNHVLALQFHLEMTPDSLKKILVNCYSDLVENKFVQSVDAILDNIQKATDNNKIMVAILDSFL